jgi:hypothetical protein
MVQGQTLTEYSSGDTAIRIRKAWESILALMKLPNSKGKAHNLGNKAPDIRTVEENHPSQTTNHKT